MITSKLLLFFLKTFCEMWVHYSAKSFSFRPSNKAILLDSRRHHYSSKVLQSVIIHTSQAIIHSFYPTKQLKSKYTSANIYDEQIIAKQNAIYHLTSAIRYAELYNISRHIQPNKKTDIIERIENIGERLFRRISNIAYIPHILAFGTKGVSSEEQRKYNSFILQKALSILDSKHFLVKNNLLLSMLFIGLKRTTRLLKFILDKSTEIAYEQ